MRSRARRPGVRRRGRTAPLNGSVTRADIAAIHAEFESLNGDVAGAPPTIDEFLTYLLGAIQDPVHGPSTRAKITAAARRREARRRAEREASEQLAQPPLRAVAAA